MMGICPVTKLGGGLVMGSRSMGGGLGMTPGVGSRRPPMSGSRLSRWGGV